MLKKKWTTPQLIVLVRGRSEEGVLAQCKSFWKWGMTGSTYYSDAGCVAAWVSPGGSGCTSCSAGSNS